MKKTLLSFFVFLLTNHLFSQPSWLFSGGAGSANAENAKSVYVDAAGNVYVTGSFSNTVDFDFGAGTANLTSAGSNDIFIASYTSAGAYRWAVRAGGTANDNATPNGAIIHDGTNLYVAGAYSGASTAFGSITISPAGGSGTDAFLAKMNPTTGAFIWVNSLGGSGNTDNISSICLDDANNPYIMGQFNGTMTVGSFSATASGTADLFIAKFNSSGTCQWLTTGGSSGNDGSSGSGICYDPVASKIIAGSSYGGTVSFGSFNLSFSGGFDLVILEINSSSGAITNAVGFGTANNDYVYSCVYDVYSGDVLMCGEFNGASITMPGSITLSNAGGIDGWVGRYDASTHAFAWAKPAGGTSVDRANAVVTDNSGLAIVVGSFSSTSASFGSFSMSTTNSGGFEDAFLVAYNVNNGTEVWATKNTNTGTQVSNNNMRGICKIDGGNSYWISGQFSQGFTLGSLSALNAVGFNDFHIGKFSLTVTATTWDGSTWSNGTPTASIDAIIASNTAPASFTCKALTINSTYALNTTGITATVNGNITNSGNGISGTGTLTIAATSTLSGNALTFGGTLNLSAGTFTTGGLLNIAPGGKITGTYANMSGSVTLQQSIIGQRGWRIFANPFSTAQTISTLASTNGISITTTPQTSGLTDARTFSNSTNLWSNVTGTTINANTAYSLFIRGLSSEVTGTNYTAGPSAFTYKATGTLNGNSVSITPTSTSNFILVGNPYAAPVRTSALTNGAGASYYVYTISQGGNQTLQRTKAGSWAPVLSSSTTNTIPVLGAIAYKPASTSTYSITAATDINTAGTLQTGLFREQNVIPHIELQVEQDGMYQDKLFIRLDANATSNGIDNTDLEKFWNDNLSIYTKSIDNKYLGIDARSAFDSIPVGISALAGNYVFKVASNSLPTGYTTYLQDNFLNTKTALKENSTYPFSVTTDAQSKGEKRFVLNFSKTIPIVIAQDFEVKVLGSVIKGNAVRVSIAGSNEPVGITVTDMLGRKISAVSNLTNGTSNINLGNVQTGMYILQISNGKKVTVEKIVKQ